MIHNSGFHPILTRLKKQVLVFFLGLISIVYPAELITTNRVNLRSGPGTQYATLGLVESQMRLPILDESDNWLKIRLNTGMIGWLHSDFADLLPVAETWKVLKTVASAKIHLGSGKDFPVVASIEKHSGLIKLADAGDWIQVLYDSAATGWVNRMMVEDWGEVNNPLSVLVVTKRGNLRAAAGLGSPIIAQLDVGQRLILLSQEGDWNQVYSDSELIGFVHTSVVKPLFSHYQSITSKVLEKSGNLRLGPSTNYRIIQMLPPSTKVYLLRQYLEWYEVITSKGDRGWINAILVSSERQPVALRQPISPDSIDVAINFLNIAEQLREAQSYDQSVRQYQLASALLSSLYRRNSGDERLVLHYARCRYALAQGLFDDQDQNIVEANRILKGIRRESEYYQQAEQLLADWKQAVSTRAEMFTIFSGEAQDLQRVLDEFTQRVSDYPLATEAEIKRLIGRYFLLNRQAAESALQWQKESVAIYNAIQLRDLTLFSYNQDHYFRVLMELAMSYANLNRRKESQKTLDEASALLKTTENPQWQEYYKQVINSLPK